MRRHTNEGHYVDVEVVGWKREEYSRTDQSFIWGAGRGWYGEYLTIENNQVWISTVQHVMDRVHSQPARERLRDKVGFKIGNFKIS